MRAPAIGCFIRFDQSDENFGHYPATDWAEMIARTAYIGFAKDVVPQRSLIFPTRCSNAHLLGSKRRDTEVAGHGLARR
jgi:hypothetical protein